MRPCGYRLSAADYRGVETPRRFHLDGRTVEIVESTDQWHGADYRYFKVKGDDGNVYILRFDEPSGEFELTMFQSPQAGTLATQVYGGKSVILFQAKYPKYRG